MAQRDPVLPPATSAGKNQRIPTTPPIPRRVEVSAGATPSACSNCALGLLSDRIAFQPLLEQAELLRAAFRSRPAAEITQVDLFDSRNQKGLFERLPVIPVEERRKPVLHAVGRREQPQPSG